ncbi:hypothetical protein [Cohnella cholangitidis]|uniref:Uncharacterized protein n=1 Tax=Cohnella cholangitidis TaxID=2598458 RepID=A0A7G5C6D9_9BACL|nr:hypothetical protein [Cohnella cholangitidis]QMV44773.1 hypothetical protein FPL14_29125 [Cohnella cholangitidis]
MNIIDGMDAARFTSANTHYNSKEEETIEVNTEMPLVLRNLNNKSDIDSTSPQQTQEQMAQQPPFIPE